MPAKAILAKPDHAAGGVPTPRLGFAALAAARQVAAQLVRDANTEKEVEAERIFDAETAAILARLRANRKPKQL
jgi:hypothetical protein